MSSPDDSMQAAPPVPEAHDGVDENEIEGDILVHLKFIHHERISLHCAKDINIGELKARVLVAHAQRQQSEAEALRSTSELSSSDAALASTAASSNDSVHLRLIYKGKVLKDDHALSLYHFVDGDTIHAVFSRPSPGSASSSSASESSAVPASTSTTSAPTLSDTHASPHVTSSMRDLGNGVMLGQINIDATADGSQLPDIAGLVSSMLQTFTSASDDVLTSARVSVVSPDGSVRHAPPSSSVARSTDSTSMAWSSAAMGSASSASMSTSEPIRSTFVSPSRMATSTPRVTVPLPVTQTPRHNQSSSSSLSNQASSIRRMMPALELQPLSRPESLREDMYELGNSIREVSDLFLSMHRQLQFLSTRFLQENHLNASEQARLRTRVRQLMPVLQQVATLASSTSVALASSRYGFSQAAQSAIDSIRASSLAQSMPSSTVAPSESYQSTAASSTTTVAPSDTESPGLTVTYIGDNGELIRTRAPGANPLNDVVQLVSVLRGLGTPSSHTESSTTEGSQSISTSSAAPTTSTASPVSSTESSSTMTEGSSSVPSGIESLLGLMGSLAPPQMRESFSAAASFFPQAPAAQVSTQTRSQDSSSMGMPGPEPSSSATAVVETPAPRAQAPPAVTIRGNEHPICVLGEEVLPNLQGSNLADGSALQRVSELLKADADELEDDESREDKRRFCEVVVQEIEEALRMACVDNELEYRDDPLRRNVLSVMVETVIKMIASTSEQEDNLDQLRNVLSKFVGSLFLEIAPHAGAQRAIRTVSQVIQNLLRSAHVLTADASQLLDELDHIVTGYLERMVSY